MYTVFNGQLMQYAHVGEEEITVKLQGLDKAITIEKDNELFGHYKAEYTALKNNMVEARQKAALKMGNANKPNLKLT